MWPYQTIQTTSVGHTIDEALPKPLPADYLVTTTSRDIWGRATTVTSPRGAATITVYDDLGRVKQVKQPAVTGGADPSVATDGADATRVIDEQVFDEARSGTKRGFPNIVRRYSPVLKDPVPKAGRTGAGLLYGTDGTITYTHATQTFTYERDNLDRPLKITQPQQGDAGEEEFLYDTGKERVKAHKDVTGVWTVYTYDVSGHLGVGAVEGCHQEPFPGPLAADQHLGGPRALRQRDLAPGGQGEPRRRAADDDVGLVHPDQGQRRDDRAGDGAPAVMQRGDLVLGQHGAKAIPAG